MPANPLKSLSDALSAVVSGVGPSLVSVSGGRRHPSSGVAWSDDGLIVTTAAAVEDARTVRVGLPDGTTAEAEVLGSDPSTDLALLRLDAGLPTPAWSDGDELAVGQVVLALGRPGRGPRAAFGIVGGLADAWQAPWGARIDRYIEVDGSLPPGFSGGPLVGVEGALLGVNTRRVVRGGTTLPTSTVRRVLASLLAHGRMRRGFLGVGVQGVRLGEGDAATAGQRAALLVSSVETGSPAEGVVRLGDVVLSVDGVTTDDPWALRGVLDGERVGTEVSVAVLRAGVVETVAVTVAERPADPHRGHHGPHGHGRHARGHWGGRRGRCG